MATRTQAQASGSPQLLSGDNLQIAPFGLLMAPVAQRPHCTDSLPTNSTCHCHFQMAKHPRSKAGHEKAQESADDYQARLTEAGLEKVERLGKTPTLSPGIDYQIIEEGGDWWYALWAPEKKPNSHRHDWVIVPRSPPLWSLWSMGRKVAKTEEEQALRMLILFFPWVNDVNDATLLVPYIGHFREPGMTSWR